VVQTQPTTPITAGASGTYVVEARDALNNLVTSFTNTVTLAFGANPGGGALGGVTSVNAVGGVATFTAWNVPTASVGYTLVASSPGLTSVTSSLFTVNAAAAASIAVFGGSGQSGAVGTPLALPLEVRVADAFNNAVAGHVVTWTVTGGGGALPATSPTNGVGVASATWTMGPTPGPATATAASAGLTGSPVTFSATALVTGLATWTGAVSTAWNVAGNWSPAAVPTVSDSVYIPDTVNDPVLSGNVAVAGLRLDPGAQLDIGSFTLDVQGNLDAGTTIIGTGAVTLTNGAGATVLGTINVPNVTVSGVYTLNGDLTIGGNLLISAGSLTVSTEVLSVSGNLTTGGTGVLNQSGVGSQVLIGGNATFGGGSTVGQLTAGTMEIAGTFSQVGGGSPFAFAASGAHTVRMNGTSPTLSFSAPTSSRFHHLVFSGSGVPDFLSNAEVGGTTDVASAMIAGVTGVGRTVTLYGALSASGGVWQVANTNVDAPGLVSFPSSLTTNLTLLGSTQIQNLTGLTGTLSIQGSARYTHSAGGTFTVTGPLSTSGLATIAQSAGTVSVNGAATFAGGSTAGLLTGGVLAVSGNFAQTGGDPAAFRASATHTTQLVGAVSQTVSFTNPDSLQSQFGTLQTQNFGPLTFSTDAVVAGGFSVLAGSSSITHSGNNVLVVLGNVSTAASTTFTPNRLYVGGALSFLGTFSPDTVEWGGTGAIPTGSINYTYGIRGTRSLTGTLTISAPGSFYVAGAGQFTINGTSTLSTTAFSTSESGRLVMTAGGSALAVTVNATFNGGDQLGLLTNGTITVGGNLTVGNGSAGRAFNAGTGNTLVLAPSGPVTLSMANVDPTGVFGNRFGTVNFTGAGVTTLSTDAAAGGTVTMALASGGTTGLARLSVGGLVDATGQKNQNASVDFVSGCATLPDSMRTNVIFSAPCSLPHNFKLTNGGSILLYGTSAQLDVNDKSLRITGVLDVQGSAARLIMDSSLDSVFVTGYARFRGGPSAGFLTAGYLAVGGNFTQANDFAFGTDGFAASGTHTVVLNGTAGQTVSFSHPGTAVSRFAKLQVRNTTVAGITFSSNATVGTLLEKPSGLAAADSVRLFAAGQTLQVFGIQIDSVSERLGRVVFDHLGLLLDDGTYTSLHDVVFRNFTGATIPLRVNRSTGTPFIERPSFLSSTAATFVETTDPNGATGGWSSVQLSNPTPSCSTLTGGGKFAAFGSTTIGCLP
jgi:hypothetical protein